VAERSDISKGDTYVELAQISPSHPALAGHFPGNPIVPGVLILTYVEEAVAKAIGARVSEVVLAKFHAPLRPTECFTIQLRDLAADVISFRVEADATLVANGKLRVIAPEQDSASDA
jgi:3-hydroxymyristoyl/3-hydroxydecanoyl-(acyl carrier protein) dehydratase